MDRTYIAAAVLLLVPSVIPAQTQLAKSGLFDKNSPHGNISGLGCKACHAPHSGSAANGLGDAATGKLLLWSQRFSTQTFGTYSSLTLQSKPAEVGGVAPAAADARLYSYLCMSCHDGVTTPAVMSANNVNAIASPSNSLGLENDHPVNMSYDPVKNPSLNSVSNVQKAGLVLFGGSSTVQCATCHDPHNQTNAPYLRIDNSGRSPLCLTCHL
jgi:predicted CXXCH cytochrome family protein